MTEQNHELQHPRQREIRELRFRLKQLSKQTGKQGETIHRLRAELAEVRELNSKIERGELRRMERAMRCMSDEIVRLHEKLLPIESFNPATESNLVQ